MGRLKVVAPAPVSPTDLISRSYITNTLLAANLSQATVDSLVSAGFSSYATRAYVDQRDALLATEDDVDAGDATRLHLSQVGVNSGVAPLESTGRMAPARVPVSSTQRWPKAFWSPAAYNAGVVTATTESGLYTCSVSDPGFTYKLLVFGLVHGKVSLDNGEYPIVYIRVGSTTGQIIAYGAGTAQYYQGPAGATASSRANFTGSFVGPDTDSWKVVPAINWIPQNTDGYTTSFSGNSMVVPTSMTATLSASLTFSGGSVDLFKAALQNAVRLFDTTSQQALVVGATVEGNQGTVTASGSVAVSAGQLIECDFGESHLGEPATVTGGYFQIVGPKVDNTGPITVIPSDLSAQSAKTGACTLYIDLIRSGSSSTVTATTSLPDLWVAAVPA